MRRKTNEAGARRPFYALLLVLLFSLPLAYIALRRARPYDASGASAFDGGGRIKEEAEHGEEDCCRGVERLELWGAAVKWGADYKVNSSSECCRACKATCGDDGHCLCDSWVFCGDRERCGEKFGECWLKKQDDVLFPALHASGEKVIWTSGLVFEKGEGIVGLQTDYGILRVKLFPVCAPRSVNYIIELLKSRDCAGCRIYRAEGRGLSWDPQGNHIADASFGPPYGLIQGILEADTPFQEIPAEACPLIRRGSVAWIGSGPEFFISLANHKEWRRSYTVFGAVLPEDMEIADKIASLPTKSDLWNDIHVLMLEKPIDLQLKRIPTVAST